MLLLLPPEARYLVDRAIDLAPQEADVLRLRHAVCRVTAKAFDRLEQDLKAGEFESRFQNLLRNAASAFPWGTPLGDFPQAVPLVSSIEFKWEILFRDIASAACLMSHGYAGRHPLPKSAVATFLSFSDRFANELCRKGGSFRPSSVVWRMEYEIAVLQPLAVACTYEEFSATSRAIYGKFLSGMEASVRDDLEAISAWQSNEADLQELKYASLVRKELEFRLLFVKLLRNGPYQETMDSGILTNVLNSKDRVEITMAHGDLDLSQNIWASEFPFSARWCPKDPILAVLWTRWHGVPLI